MIDKQALNKKLTLWSGGEDYFTDEEGCPHRKIIQFPDSLDACFKWLVPKLYQYEINSYNHDGIHNAWVSLALDKWEAAKADNPSLALCLAIEKLIDSEVKK